jgi:hypothetical protein
MYENLGRPFLMLVGWQGHGRHDIARYKSDEPNDVIKNWMRGRDTIEFLGLWESLHNSDFKPVEFDGFIFK